jgi:deoxycytidylate deaminase
MNRLDKSFDVALAASLLSTAPRIGLRMGAALYAGSRLLSVGCNWYNRTHPSSGNHKDYSLSVHAEHAALLRRQHYENTKGMTMYVARMRADGSLGCSKPCSNCLDLCRIVGVQRIRYFDHDANQKELIL